MSAEVRVTGLDVSLGGRQILHDVDFAVPAGEFCTLLGPSGSGKTTTLNVVAGFLPAASGSVTIGGMDVANVPPAERDIGIVFQNYALFPHMTVQQNVEFPLSVRRMDKAARRRLSTEYLDLVGLGDEARRSIRTLSGGQKQRVALARALVSGPKILLLDEPLGALDKQLREAMQLEVKRIQTELGITTLAVTHDQVEALTMSDRIGIMRDGRIEQLGSVEEVYRRPRNSFVAQFLGEANVLRAGEVAASSAERGTGLFILRPEVIRIEAPEPGHPVLPAVVCEIVFQGDRYRMVVETEARTRIIVSLPGHAECSLVVGDRVTVSFDPGDGHWVGDGLQPEMLGV